MLLKKANQKIADLKEDIQRLSDELQMKDSFIQKSIASLSATIQDTDLWDPSTYSRLRTPIHQLSWAEVVVRGRKRYLDGTWMGPHLSLSNHYVTLTDDTLFHPADAPVDSP